jgi:hypothetical protein
MKTWEEINVNEILSLEDFLTLFSKLPLIEEEKLQLEDYHKMYLIFVESGIELENAWITVRNIFAIKNQQIAERIKANETSPLKIVK